MKFLIINDYLKQQLITLFVLSNLLIIQSLLAQEVRVYAKDEIPDPNDIAIMLGGGDKNNTKLRMRGIVFQSAVKNQSINSDKPVVAHVYEDNKSSAFSVPIQFEYDSAQILQDAELTLEAVAKGIKMVPNAKIVIEGHTDSVGTMEYNQLLSLRRAKSVRHYLISEQGLTEGYFKVVGLGESNPVNKENTEAAVNRRVQFRLAD